MLLSYLFLQNAWHFSDRAMLCSGQPVWVFHQTRFRKLKTSPFRKLSQKVSKAKSSMSMPYRILLILVTNLWLVRFKDWLTFFWINSTSLSSHYNQLSARFSRQVGITILTYAVFLRTPADTSLRRIDPLSAGEPTDFYKTNSQAKKDAAMLTVLNWLWLHFSFIVEISPAVFFNM